MTSLSLLAGRTVHPHTMKRTPEKFQKDRNKTKRGVELTKYPLIASMDRHSDWQTDKPILIVFFNYIYNVNITYRQKNCVTEDSCGDENCHYSLAAALPISVYNLQSYYIYLHVHIKAPEMYSIRWLSDNSWLRSMTATSLLPFEWLRGMKLLPKIVKYCLFWRLMKT